jgi:hypothetical protein
VPVLPSPSDPVFNVFAVPEREWELYEVIQRNGLVGILAKQAADQHGPATAWYEPFVGATTLSEAQLPGMHATRGRIREGQRDDVVPLFGPGAIEAVPFMRSPRRPVCDGTGCRR